MRSECGPFQQFGLHADLVAATECKIDPEIFEEAIRPGDQSLFCINLEN